MTSTTDLRRLREPIWANWRNNHNFINLNRLFGVKVNDVHQTVIAMAKYLIARQLSGKKIVTNDGEDFGRLVDINVNEVSGKIETLIIEPNPDSETASKMKREDGMVNVAYESVLAVGDFIIVEKRNMSY